MDDYSFLRDLLETWRSTTDWVKAVVVIAIPTQIVFLIYLVLQLRTEQRQMRIDEREAATEAMTELRVRELAEAELCRIIAEMERARREGETTVPAKRISEGGQQWPA
ncbi:MAG: hypothetical protein AB3N20_11670 [Rhizobiaceae bacterium]